MQTREQHTHNQRNWDLYPPDALEGMEEGGVLKFKLVNKIKTTTNKIPKKRKFVTERRTADTANKVGK